MKQFFVVVALIVVCLPGLVAGQPGGIGLYVDHPAYTACDYTEYGMALVPVYVIHKLCPGAKASRFAIQPGGGLDFTHVGETSPHFTLGFSQTGICVEYDGCTPAVNLLLLTINYVAFGTAPACSWLEVVPDPTALSGTIEVLDCGDYVLAASSSKIYVNPDMSCQCWISASSNNSNAVAESRVLRRNSTDIIPDFCTGVTIPVKYNSWGHIKALYK
jgi:hypothetical protein